MNSVCSGCQWRGWKQGTHQHAPREENNVVKACAGIAHGYLLLSIEFEKFLKKKKTIAYTLFLEKYANFILFSN